MRVFGSDDPDVPIIEDEAVVIDLMGDEGADEAAAADPVGCRRRCGERPKAHRNELEPCVNELLRLRRSVDIEWARGTGPAALEEIVRHHVGKTHVVIGVKVSEEDRPDLA